MHENVMAVMMNTLGRRAQAQSQPGGTPVTGQDGEIVPKEKVTIDYKNIYTTTFHLYCTLLVTKKIYIQSKLYLNLVKYKS